MPEALNAVILCFIAFFQGNLKFRNKISFTVRIKSLTDIGTDRCAGTQELTY